MPLVSVVQSSQGSYHCTVWYSPSKAHTTGQCGTVQPRLIPLDSVVQPAMAHTTGQCSTVQPRLIPLDSVVQPAMAHTTGQCSTVQPGLIPLDSVVQSSQGSYHWTV
ncbi:hypothetical protein BgiBS90_029380 [Biomphalaria glabrata]|nr:hypothetical protein BgiBS90_029380 [Biomphalaria glabrata]